MNKISPCDGIICDGVIDMLRLRPVWNWHAYRAFPFFRRGSERIRNLYCFSRLGLNGARDVNKRYEYNLDETKNPWVHFKHFIIALSNEGVWDESIMNILTELAKYIEKEKTNKLLERHGWFVPYDLK